MPRPSEGQDADGGKPLPAFSIPDEFAVQAEAVEENAEKEEPGEDSADADEAAPASDAQPVEADESGNKTRLSADAAEFVPGDVQAPNGGFPSLMEMVGPPSTGQFGEEYPAATESWGYTQQDSIAEEPFVPGRAAGVDGFEFSASAPVFMPPQEQAHGIGPPYAASPFVPGVMNAHYENPMVFPNGVRGHIVGPPVLVPINAVTQMHMDPIHRSDEEWSDGGEARADFDGRPLPQHPVPAHWQNAGGGRVKGQGGGSSHSPKKHPRSKTGKHSNSGEGSEGLATPLPPGPIGGERQRDS